MNTYIQILDNPNTLSGERTEAINSLIQIKNEIESHVKNLPVDKTVTNINIDNVNKIMYDIKDNLDTIQFDNLQDIKKLFKLKSQIIECNKVLATTKPTINIKDGENTIDITNTIKDKFVIADLMTNSI